MKHASKRILSFFCALCLLMADWGGVLPQVISGGAEAAYSATREVSASDGKTYAVTVTCDDDSIPEDAVLCVAELADDDRSDYVAESAALLGTQPESLTFARAFDISLRDPETDTEYQPGGSVKVSITLLDTDLAKETGVSVVHFGDGPEVLDSALNGDTVEFETDGFSVYVLAGEEALGTYIFYARNSFGDYQAYEFFDDQGNYFGTSQTIKNGEKLVAPQIPPSNFADSSKEFMGWYEGTGGDQNPTLAAEPFDFDKPQELTETGEIHLFAKYAKCAYVTFHGQYDAETHTYPIQDVLRVDLESGPVEVDISTISTDYHGADSNDYTFYGWSQIQYSNPDQGSAQDLVNTTGGKLSVSGDIDLYPLFREVHWLSLSSGYSGSAATYYSPVPILAGESLSQAEMLNYVPTRPGYDFEGWYLDLDPAGGSANPNTWGTGAQVTTANGMFCDVNDSGIRTTEGELELSAHVTLYARWTPHDVKYTIVVWKQRTTDDSYDWAGSVVKYAAPATVVTLADVSAAVAASDFSGALADYNLTSVLDADGKPVSESQAVNFEGNTVFSLYYKRNADAAEPRGNEYTLTFKNGENIVREVTFQRGAFVYTVFPDTEQPLAEPGYDFHWYLDKTCTNAVSNEITMPDHDLTVYAGLEKQWYLIQIDPNYGTMNDPNASTYFWKAYKGDYIQEYTWITRGYEESESGEWYYVYHDYNYRLRTGDNNRKAYYTTNISEATSLTTYKEAPNTYLYDGWYEVHADGTETPYVFGNLITGNTTLRLHWKQSGTYFLQYNTDVTVGGERLIGTMSDASILPRQDGYTDHAKITLGGTAIAPDEYVFAGWTVRGDNSGTVYYPGRSFTLPSEYAVTVNGRKTVYLDAVYTRIKTAKIVFHANGGTISADADAGAALDAAGADLDADKYSVSRDEAAGTVTLSSLVNNSRVRLSNGTGFTAPEDSNARLLGWNTEPNGKGEHYDLDSKDKDGKYLRVNVDEPVTLYAEWGITVYFDKNDSEAVFGSNWNSDDGYYWDSMSDRYAIDTYVHATLAEPKGTVTKEGATFDFWSTQPNGDQQYAFDFGTKLTGALTLYAHFSGAKKVPFHVLSSNGVKWDAWKRTATLRVTETPLDLTLNATLIGDYVTPVEGYTYAYACLCDAEFHSVKKITALKLVDNEVIATDENGADAPIPDGQTVCLVFSTVNVDPRVKLAYVQEGEGGALSNVVGANGAITYNGQTFNLLNGVLVDNYILSSDVVANGAINGDTVTGQVLTLSETPLEVSQRYAADPFNAPPLLDNYNDERALVHDSFGVANQAAGNISDMTFSASSLYLRYHDGKHQWSANGSTTWTTFTGDTLYVVYRPRGYELTICKSVTGSNTGVSPDASFDVTVSSMAITRTSYKVEGTGYSTVSAEPASGSTPGVIRLTVKDGSDIRISGLPSGTYTVTETHNANFTLRAKVYGSPKTVTNDSVSITLSQDGTVELFNDPATICQILDTANGGYKTFYTLNSALEYAKVHMDGSAEIEMTRDYVMPAWDELEIPAGYDITITTAGTLSDTKKITRDPAFTAAPMITNYGTLKLGNVTLDGGGIGVQARSAMVRNLASLTVDGATLQNANKTTGDGGAIYQSQGTLTVKGASAFSNNTATGSGGAIYVYSGGVNVSGGTFSGNAAQNGGAVCYAGNDTFTITGGTFSANTAQNGGAIYADSGSITVSGGTLSGNTAAQHGGAIYAQTGTLTVNGSSAFSNNTAAQHGGAIYIGSGEVNVSGGAMSGNTATDGNGGAIYAQSGTVTVSGGAMSGNTATNGNGGAAYIGSGTMTMTAGTIGASGAPNSAKNGAGVFVNTGTANFSGGTITGNTATAGGAVGVGSADARLFFSQKAKVSDNTNGTVDANVYLDRNSDEIINFDSLDNAAKVGIYIADSVMASRGVPGTTFASYNGNNNVKKATVPNDRDPSFEVISQASTKKLYWGNPIKVEVRYQSKSFATITPPSGTLNTDYKSVTISSYYPIMGEDGSAAISTLAEDIYNNVDLKALGLSTTAAYAGAYLSGSADYFTKLTWDRDSKEWKLIGHYDDGTAASRTTLGSSTLVIYYAEPAYISIENNTGMKLTIDRLHVGGKSVVNTQSAAGYGMVFAKNGAIRSALLPVELSDLTLDPDKSVNLLIPGGRNMSYTLTGHFETTEAAGVRLRITDSGTYDQAAFSVGADGSFTFPADRKTMNKAGTNQIVFGDDKMICKIVTAQGPGVNPSADFLIATGPDSTGKVEYVFKSMKQAADFITKYMSASKTATIEMLTDYLLPASDNVGITAGYNITLTTASSGTYHYTPAVSGESRATISRDSENTNAMFTATGNADNPAGTTFTIKDLIIDGKSVRGNSDGGAVSTKDCNVTVEHAKFLNIYAGNGGALFVAITDKKHGKGSSLSVTDSDFLNCYSSKTGSRDGGGAVHAYVDALTLENCTFTSCEAYWQGGAVFHKVELTNTGSGTSSLVKNCTFTSCKSRAAGGMELGSHNITVTGCTFEHCVATDRNGGGFNVYALNSASPTVECHTTVRDCSFDDCHVTGTNPGNGGGFRSTSTHTTIINTTFNNTSAKFGGAVALSNASAVKAEVYGCSISNAKATSYGGGIFSSAKEFIIGDGYYYLDNNKKAVTVLKDGDHYTDLSGNQIADNSILNAIQSQHTEIKNCTATGKGGGIYHTRDADGTSLNVTNAVITGNTSNGNDGYGGGVSIYRVRSVNFTGCTISNNIAAKRGGGIWIGDNDNSKRTMIVDSSTIQGNTSSDLGGGIYSYAQLTLRNNTSITKNRITVTPTDAWTNAGGVFLPDNYALTVGTAGATTPDSTTVKDNTNGSGAASDVRLWWDNNGKSSKAASVSVLCDLDGEIRVVNPGKTTQQFGSRANDRIAGFTEGKHVFVADSGGLYGVYNRNEPLKLIWRGGAVCKITDANGRLLYLDEACTDPAVFDRLDYSTDGSKLSPFSYLRQSNVTLYRKNETTPIDLTEESIQIKLLVSSFETDTSIKTGTYSDRQPLTLTTAGSTESDGYPYTGRAGSYAVIKRAYSGGGSPLITAGVNLTLRNITLDGGADDGLSFTCDGALIYANVSKIKVTLGPNSILQDAYISNNKSGGGVFVNNGASLAIEGGAIYNCSTVGGNGGGVWKGGNGTFDFTSGIISKCSANNGGGVSLRDGSGVFTMSGSAQITGCTATLQGGGVWLDKNVTMTMAGGSITGNSAGTDGGGIFITYDTKSHLNFSGRVTVSGNTCGDDPCNVQLGLGTANNNPNNNGSNTWVPAGTNPWDAIITSKGISRNSYIGIYVPGEESPGSELEQKTATVFDRHGLKTRKFGTFESGTTTDFLYCFVNDRNGLKGGLELGDSKYIHWVEIFSLQVSKTVLSGSLEDLEADFEFTVTFSRTPGGQADHDFCPDGQQYFFTYDGAYPEKTDDEDNPKTVYIKHGVATFTLRSGESITAMNLPAEVNQGHLYYKVEENLDTDQAAHYTTSTSRSTNPSDSNVRYVTGTISENLHKEDVTSKYTSYAMFDNITAVCKLTSDINGGVLLNTLDPVSGNYVPAVYSALYTNSSDNPGAFDVINAGTALYYFDAFARRYKQYSYTGNDELRVEMLVDTYEHTRNLEIQLSPNRSVTLKTASRTATDGFPYVGSGTTATIINKQSTPVTMFYLTRNGSAGAKLTLENIILDGDNRVVNNRKGGLVRVDDYTTLNITTGAVLQNAKVGGTGNGAAVYIGAKGSATMDGGIVRNNACTGATSGGAFYVSAFKNSNGTYNGGELTITGGTIMNNTCESGGNGAGIYLHDVDGKGTAKLYISGAPVFSGNLKNETLTGQTNGSTPYTQPRQDIYIAEAHGGAPASIVVTGDLTGAVGSIWVWANSADHCKQLTPFAKLATGVVYAETPANGQFSSEHLKVFRNARDDETTENGTDTWLYGTIEGEPAGYVYWSGVSGSREVILRKVNGSFEPLPGATFTIYRGTSTTPYEVKTKVGGTTTTETLENLTSLDSGVIWIGMLPYGVYTLLEDNGTTFKLTVNAEGVGFEKNGTISSKMLNPA